MTRTLPRVATASRWDGVSESFCVPDGFMLAKILTAAAEG
jgi:hypothetical protein